MCGSPATPLVKDKHHVCPLTVPPLFSVNSQEIAADRSEDASVTFSKHTGMKQQVTDVTTFSVTKYFAACSFTVGGRALPTAWLTQAALVSHAVGLFREDERKEGFMLFSFLDIMVDSLPTGLSCRPALFLQSPPTASECFLDTACFPPWLHLNLYHGVLIFLYMQTLLFCGCHE